MVEKKIVALGLICVILSVGFVGAVMMLNQKETEIQMKSNQISGLENEKLALETQAETLQLNISGLQSEIGSLSNAKAALEAQVSSLQSNVTSLNNEKSALGNQVSSLQTDFAELENEKSTLEIQVSALQANVSSLQTEIVSLESEVAESFNLGYQDGYDEGYAQGGEDWAQSGWYFTDPTYDEAIAFIDSDETDKNEYTEDYVCYDFTADFNDNAAEAGYRCGFVYIEFFDSAHSIACFNTTDSGLIYIEPQTDEIVDITVGQVYLDEIIVHIGIIW